MLCCICVTGRHLVVFLAFNIQPCLVGSNVCRWMEIDHYLTNLWLVNDLLYLLFQCFAFFRGSFSRNLLVSGEHLQFSLCEASEAQDGIFERGFLRFKTRHSWLVHRLWWFANPSNPRWGLSVFPPRQAPIFVLLNGALLQAGWILIDCLVINLCKRYLSLEFNYTFNCTVSLFLAVKGFLI